jgi:hypothetical protein
VVTFRGKTKNYLPPLTHNSAVESVRPQHHTGAYSRLSRRQRVTAVSELPVCERTVPADKKSMISLLGCLRYQARNRPAQSKAPVMKNK